eukprot:9635951-Prorocentrum_lima.AAC.1
MLTLRLSRECFFSNCEIIFTSRVNRSFPPQAEIPTACPLVCAVIQVLNIFNASSAVFATPGSPPNL